MGSGNGDSSIGGPRHPHPITSAHERIYKGNAIAGSLVGAMEAGDYRAMRRMNEAYKAEYPESSMLQSGYDIIADWEEGTVFWIFSST